MTRKTKRAVEEALRTVVPSDDDLRIMIAAIDAWRGRRVQLTPEQWARAELLLDGAA